VSEVTLTKSLLDVRYADTFVQRPGRLRSCERGHGVLTLMDAASLASTTALDLSHTDSSPDFVTISFYKIFGLPDLGALLVQKRHFPLLQRRRYFGGGTVEMVTSKPHAWHALKQDCIHEALEDGTLPFHWIIALGHAIDIHEEIYGPDPMQAISRHTTTLVQELRRSLLGLRHGNGLPVVKTYGDNRTQHIHSDQQGAVLALNISQADGALVGHKEVERRASSCNIYVRSGSLCNPGGVAKYLGWDSKDLGQAYDAGYRCSNPNQFALGELTGVVRVSLGASSTVSDTYAFIRFVRQTYVR
jgi:molybdenum cofactor sulfurtransferase